MKQKESEFVSRLLRWQAHNDADFPWRRTKDPYKILVSELLLRKTTRKQVSQIYDTFFSKFPTIEALASSEEKVIKKAIVTLGMEHKRAPALKKVAQTIIDSHGGKIPTRSGQLMGLPYVGRYTSNALLCLAYGQDYPLLDTNVVRVITRVFSLKSSKNRPREDPQMWDFVSSLIPSKKARDFNLAVLDIAFSICRADNPDCQACPLLDICDYGIAGIKGLR